GISTFQRINRADESFRSAIFRGKCPPNAPTEVDEVIELLYRSWADTSSILLQRLGELEREGFEATGADEFRSCCRELQGILTEDREFITSDRLAALRDDAIDAHRRGDVTEIRNLND